MKKAILVVSFGTTYEKTRKLCIESVENKIKEEFKDFEVTRAFTAQMVIEKLKKRDRIVVDNVPEALEKLRQQGFDEIDIQSLHIIPGIEYEMLINQVEKFKQKYNFKNIKIGKPLLNDKVDYEKVIDALNIKICDKDKAVVFMGHGTNHSSDKCYDILQNEFKDRGFNNIYIGTVEGSITVEDIIFKLKKDGIKKVILRPFMLVAGEHATNDMAGEGKDSWKNKFLKEGFGVEIILHGLGENLKIQELFISHLKESVNSGN